MLDQFAHRLGAHSGAEDARATWTLAAELRIKGAEAVEFVVTANFRKQLIWLQAEERLLLLGDLLLTALCRGLRVGAQAGDLTFGERLQVGTLLLALLIDLVLLVRERLFRVQ